MRAEPAGTAMPERILATAFRSVLGALAEDGPVVVAIDDVQWLDTSSADMLAFVIRRLGRERVGLLVAHRAGTRDPLRTDRLDPPSGASLDLGPLTVGALHHVIRQQLGQTLSWSVLGRVHEAAGGNALFAVEIARKLVATGVPAPGERLPVPDDVRELVGPASASSRRGPGTSCSSSPPAPAPWRRPASRRSRGGPSRDDLRLAEQGDVVRRSDGAVAFAHPLFADAVYTAAAPADRRRAHAALAADATDPEERARHLALASDGPDEGVAAALEDAGIRGRAAWRGRRPRRSCSSSPGGRPRRTTRPRACGAGSSTHRCSMPPATARARWNGCGRSPPRRRRTHPRPCLDRAGQGLVRRR